MTISYRVSLFVEGYCSRDGVNDVTLYTIQSLTNFPKAVGTWMTESGSSSSVRRNGSLFAVWTSICVGFEQMSLHRHFPPAYL
jgi:hypothetical protein